MKKITLFFAAIAIAFVAQAQTTTYKVLKINKGTDVVYEIPLADFDSITFDTRESEDERTYHNNHEYVDLGLPSGTLWATCNVGATNPEDYGDYFAWGETESKEKYDWKNEGEYKWGVYTDMNNYSMTKYNGTDKETVLAPEDDAATANWGGEWRIPTTAELDELKNECTWSSTTLNGVKGFLVTSKKDATKSIFLPAAGCYEGSSSPSYKGSRSYCLSSSLGTREYYAAGFRYSDSSTYQGTFKNNKRCNGLSVRPVFSAQ